ncbi:MAG: lmo0937 family membrane protein [Cyanobacteria bacterium]|uniref:lmo0937 family membrane protein n=1 Tax=Geminocystis sp. TaxID=2664100 RepID=UPI001DC3AC54|nr:lmo0937 family membrane protein [Cyanobacteria bacterium CG_2015-16_32_12]NCO77613.1 lmo0937 family membrane protein [Cyanobacteria bacterium CG_2015-22_32_23]NCQ03305.1 lmo0937 family membrane protein [Cyanobacteria bacterium CG_2015-09_32_10]NCQ41905.1 lmo0937 family membrane protein [Cyanobacteria bacterium CG_2015-04_32_10]NCS83459.1 lmo0937 family membrane protein [Cyanobacteria bacterium CG_2015-02_32_10]
MFNLIWTAVGVLLILWLLGFSIHIGGGLIHLLLVLALIGIVYNLFIGRRIG